MAYSAEFREAVAYTLYDVSPERLMLKAKQEKLYLEAQYCHKSCKTMTLY